MMVGRDLRVCPAQGRRLCAHATLLSVRNLRDGAKVKDVSFDLRRGEVLVSPALSARGERSSPALSTVHHV